MTSNNFESQNVPPKVFTFLENLRQNKIPFRLNSYRDDTICVDVRPPGSRWEVEFFADGEVEVEVFISVGNIFGEEKLAELRELFHGKDS